MTDVPTFAPHHLSAFKRLGYNQLGRQKVPSNTAIDAPDAVELPEYTGNVTYKLAWVKNPWYQTGASDWMAAGEWATVVITQSPTTAPTPIPTTVYQSTSSTTTTPAPDPAAVPATAAAAEQGSDAAAPTSTLAPRLILARHDPSQPTNEQTEEQQFTEGAVELPVVEADQVFTEGADEPPNRQVDASSNQQPAYEEFTEGADEPRFTEGADEPPSEGADEPRFTEGADEPPIQQADELYKQLLTNGPIVDLD
jgi:hypothetical protein